MKEKKELKGVSRRTFCKLVSGGAVAIGGSGFLPSPAWKMGDAGLLGVQVAEAMTVVKMKEAPREPYVTPLFTGPDVTRQSLISALAAAAGAGHDVPAAVGNLHPPAPA